MGSWRAAPRRLCFALYAAGPGGVLDEGFGDGEGSMTSTAEKIYSQFYTRTNTHDTLIQKEKNPFCIIYVK